MKKDKAKELECIQCNRCLLNCPLNRVDPSYSPRGCNLQLLMEGKEKFTDEKDLYRCLTCFQCFETCPSKNKYVDAVKTARKEAKEQGRNDECKHGTILRTIQNLQATLDKPQNRLKDLDPESYSESGDVMYFMGCLPIFDQIFTHTESLNTAKNVLKILNHLGLKPVMSNREKCCGYDILWSGETEDYDKLATSNIKLFKELGIKKIITSCAECYLTLKEEYSKKEELNIEVKHITQVISEAINDGKLKLDEKVEETVTYHDPCRLGRIGKVYNEPREILNNVSELKFKEMENIKENSNCCGVGNFSNCDSFTKHLQNERLKEASETGAKHVITACPKCRIHFNCYLDGNPIEELPELKITDITEIVARAIKKKK